MPMRALVFLAAAMAATPAFSADPAKRDADRPAASWFVATPSEATTMSADKNNNAAQAKKPKRVRHIIPAPTRM